LTPLTAPFRVRAPRGAIAVAQIWKSIWFTPLRKVKTVVLVPVEF
jgi:hypothetical protein